jgi:acyl carrier protein
LSIGGRSVIKHGVDSELGEKTSIVDVSTMVLTVVGEMSGVADVEPDSELVAELGFDSLGLVELLVVLEDTFNLPSIDIESLGRIEKVADVQRVVREVRAQMPAIEASQ